MSVKSIKKYIFLFLGFLFLALGLIGIPIPVLPTTPFLLLAAYFFLNSSSKAHQKLIHNKYLGKYIKQYQDNKSIPLWTKIASISFMWITYVINCWLFVSHLHAQIVYAGVLIAVSIHILKLRTNEN